MRNGDRIEFRYLEEDSFLKDLKEGELKPILDFEKNYRDSFLIEIRKNYLDLYFLGHAIKVERTNSDYNLSSAQVFRPDRVGKWPISFHDIKEKYKDYEKNKYKSEFEEFMSEIMFKIIRHKKGDISEGVSEMNHYIDNRIIYKPGDIVVIDRQVTHGRARIDLLGLKKMNNGKLSFVVFELKKKEIEGIIVLDNYNLRSIRLKSALEKDWANIHDSYNIKLFLKTNTFDDNFFWNYEEARKKNIWNL